MTFKPPAPQTDPRVQAARRGALLFLVSGLLAVTQAFALLKPGDSRDLFVCLSLLDFGVAALLWYLPWGRWPEQALYAVIPVALATIALFNASSVVPPYAYSAFFPVLAIWVGLSLPPSTALLSSPLVFAAYLLPYSPPGPGGRGRIRRHHRRPEHPDRGGHRPPRVGAAQGAGRVRAPGARAAGHQPRGPERQRPELGAGHRRTWATRCCGG